LSKPQKKGINPKLVKALNDLLDEVTKRPKPGEEAKYSLTDKVKVLDRVIDLEKLRLGQEDNSEGEFFKNRGAEDE